MKKSPSTARPQRREVRSARGRPGRPAASFAVSKSRGSEAAAPEATVAPQHERQVLLVSGPALVLRQLQLLLDAIPALAGLGLGLHRGRRVLQERQLILDVLLGAEPATGSAGVAGNQLVPVHRQHLLDRVFSLER